MTVAAVIPALNEAESVGPVVTSLAALAFGGSALEVIVVDNGSTDNTAAVAAAAGAVVVSETRRGYGWACAAGSNAAIGRGAEVIVYLDADGSSLAAEVSDVVGPVLDDAADLVLGSRVLGTIAPGSMAPHQRFGNRLSAALMRRLYDIEVTDLGPFRAIRGDLLTQLAMTEMTFGWPTEMTVKAARRDARIIEVPVTWAPRTAGDSKVSGTISGSIRAGYHIVSTTLRHSRGGVSSDTTR